MYNFTKQQITDFKITEINGGVKKKANFPMVGEDGNAFNLLALFRKAAKREKWTQEEIDYVIWKATSGDYSTLLATLADHCVDPSGEESGNIVYIDGKPYKKL